MMPPMFPAHHHPARTRRQGDVNWRVSSKMISATVPFGESFGSRRTAVLRCLVPHSFSVQQHLGKRALPFVCPLGLLRRRLPYLGVVVARARTSVLSPSNPKSQKRIHTHTHTHTHTCPTYLYESSRPLLSRVAFYDFFFFFFFNPMGHTDCWLSCSFSFSFSFPLPLPFLHPSQPFLEVRGVPGHSPRRLCVAISLAPVQDSHLGSSPFPFGWNLVSSCSPVLIFSVFFPSAFFCLLSTGMKKGKKN